MSGREMTEPKLKAGMDVSRFTIIGPGGGNYPPEVYLATDKNLGRKTVLQFLPDTIRENDEARSWFASQSQEIAAISHPNLTHIYEFSEYNGQVFVAMENAGERTLEDVLSETRPTPRQAISIAIQTCSGLVALAEAGIAHRDLHPGQIAISDSWQVRLLMIGHFVRSGNDYKEHDRDKTELSEYHAPEEWNGEKTDIKSNLYSLGVILYEMVTGNHPYRLEKKSDFRQAMDNFLEQELTESNDIPFEILRVLEKSLKRDPGQRYLFPGYMLDDLEVAQNINSLKESEEQYRNLVERASDGICIIQNQRLRYINRQLADFVGYSIEEGLNTPFADYIHPDEIPKVVGKYNLMMTGREKSQRYETRLVHKSGSAIEVEINAGPISYDGHSAVLAIVRDISERKRSEDSLRRSEKKYSALFQHSTDAIFIHDLEGRIIDINEKAMELFGYGKDEMLRLSIRDLHPPEAQKASFEQFEKFARDRFINFEIDFIRKNGEIFQADVSSGIFEVGGETFIQGIVRDISERKKTESIIRESRRAMATLIGNLPGMVYRCHNDPNWTMEFISNGCREMTGYSPGELIGNAALSYNDLIHPDDREMVWNEIQVGLNAPKNFQITYRIITRDGRTKWVWEQGCGVFDEDGKLEALEGFISDITKNRRAEEHLRLLSSIVKQSTEGIALVNFDGEIQFINKAFAEMHGYQPEELLHKNLSIFHAPGQMEAVERANRQIREKGQFSGEIWHRRRNGSVFPAYMNNSLLYDNDGRPRGMIGTIRDITRRKKAQEELEAAVAQRDATLNALPDLLFEIDRAGRIYDFRAPHPELLYVSPSEFLGKTMAECVPPHVAEAVEEVIGKTIEKGHCSGIVYPLDLAGKTRWFEVSAAIMGDINTSKGRIIMLARDITDRREAEQALRKSEEKFRRIFENSILGLYRTTPDGQVLMVNPALLNMLGYSSFEELAKRNLEESGYEPGYDRSEFKEIIEREGIVVGLESAWTKKDGSTLYVRESARAIRDDEGKTLYYEGTVEDITIRKLIEKEMAKAAEVIEQERNMFVTGPVVVFRWENRPGRPIEYVSPNVSEVFGYTPRELVAEKFHYADLIPETDAERVLNETTAYDESGADSFSHQPYQIVRKDGQTIWVADYTTIIRNENGITTHFLGYVIDITERKLAEDMLRRRTEQLSSERKALKDKNIALNQILEHIESQRRDNMKQIFTEVEKTIKPFLKRLKSKAGSEFARDYQSLIDNLDAIMAKDMDDFSVRYARLTSRESQICELIKNGKSSKQISEELNLSLLTVLKHREQIRKKLDLTNKGVNLATYLRSHE